MPQPDLSSLTTPSLLLDRARMERNIARLKGHLRSLGVGHIVLSTQGDWLKPLIGFLKIERRRR